MRGERPNADATISFRLPYSLKVLLEALSYKRHTSLSYTVIHLLESHPDVVAVAERLSELYNESKDHS